MLALASAQQGNSASIRPIIGGKATASSIFFTSAATNIVVGVTFPPGTNQTFRGDAPVVLSKLPRDFGYSGGNNGKIALAQIQSNGNPVNVTTFTPFAGYTGEIRVATGDFNGDGTIDIVAGAGPGGGPRVVMIDGFTGRTINDFYAFEPTFTGGVYVAVGDLNGDGKAELIVGAGETGGPRMQVYDSTGTFLQFDDFAFEPSARTGVRVSSGDFNFDGNSDIIVSAGIGGGPRVRVFNGANLTPGMPSMADFFAYELIATWRCQHCCWGLQR